MSERAEFSPAPAPAPAPVSRLGRYELVAHLATGGMGDVHLARLAGPAGFQRWVVVKVLLPELAPSARYRDMFFAEARLAGRLAHPNACEVLDLGEERGTYYIVMPYLDGVPLAAMMARPADADAAWYERLVTGIIAQACEGLHHAHQLTDDDGAPLGVVHRDVSPSNVMVLRDGLVKVVDFGIAKSRASVQETEKDVIKGKPAYMAPEQLAGGAIDRRADVFCAGILLWEAIAQRPLFARASAILSARAVLEDPAPALEVAPPLAAVVARALAKEPFKRHATVEALRQDLVAAMADRGGVMSGPEIAAAVAAHWADRLRAAPAADADLPTIPGVPMAPSQVATVARSPRPPRAAPRHRAIAVVALVAATVGVAIYLALAASATDTGGDAGATNSAAAAAQVRAAAGAGAGVIVAVPAPLTAAPAPLRPVTPARAPRKTGLLSVDSSPWATIYVDGQRLGITPLIGKRLSAGKHALRAVAEDGRTQERDLVIEAGTRPTPIRLHW